MFSGQSIPSAASSPNLVHLQATLTVLNTGQLQTISVLTVDGEMNALFI